MVKTTGNAQWLENERSNQINELHAERIENLNGLKCKCSINEASIETNETRFSVVHNCTKLKGGKKFE